MELWGVVHSSMIAYSSAMILILLHGVVMYINTHACFMCFVHVCMAHQSTHTRRGLPHCVVSCGVVLHCSVDFVYGIVQKL